MKFYLISMKLLTNSANPFSNPLQRSSSGLQKATYEARTGFYSIENCFSKPPVTVLFCKSFQKAGLGSLGSQ
jgi:hypothetical protein